MRIKDEEKILTSEFLAELKRIREEKGISLEEVAERTNIKFAYIKAIEEGKLSELPGGIYNRAYIRSVSEFLGVDTKPFEKRITGEEMFTPHKMELEFGRDLKSVVPTKTIISVCILAIILVYLMFFSGSESHKENVKSGKRENAPPGYEVDTKVKSSTISILALKPTRILLMNEDDEEIVDKTLKVNEAYIYTLNEQTIQEETLLKVDNIDSIEIYLNGILVPNINKLEKDEEYYLLTFQGLFGLIDFTTDAKSQKIP